MAMVLWDVIQNAVVSFGLRDTNGDGRADETKVFCEVDAPRGLVWDHDRLYLVHPPHLSVIHRR